MNFLQGFLMVTGVFWLLSLLLRATWWLVRTVVVLCVDIVLRGYEFVFRFISRLDPRYERAHFFFWKWRVIWDAFIGRDVSYLDQLDGAGPPDGPGSKAAAERAWHAKWDRK